MRVHSKACGKGFVAVAEDLHEVILVEAAVLHQPFESNLGEVRLRSILGELRDVKGEILYAVGVIEAKLRQSTLERHLTTFEAKLLVVAGAALCTLMTAGGGTAHAAARAAADASAGVG